jgi:hypothetical protein
MLRSVQQNLRDLQPLRRRQYIVGFQEALDA